MAQVLIIGYGNSMRGDDAVGCHVARMLENHYRGDPEVRVMGGHQLTPEMAEDVAGSEFVLFLDAAVGSRVGEINDTAVTPRPGPLSLAHFLTPDLLLSAAVELYGKVPRAKLLTIVGGSFGVGDGISATVSQRVPELFQTARTIVESCRCRVSGQ